MASWLSILDVVVDIANLALSKRTRRAAASTELELPAPTSRAVGHLETHLAGVVVAALKEAFDRDASRLEREREQMERERERAERALKLELLRQTGDREIDRLRLVAGVALASLVGALFVSLRLSGASLGARVLSGAAWLLLLGALSVSFAAQASVGRALAHIDEPSARGDDLAGGGAAPWLIVAGLAAIGTAVLIG